MESAETMSAPEADTSGEETQATPIESMSNEELEAHLSGEKPLEEVDAAEAVEVPAEKVTDEKEAKSKPETAKTDDSDAKEIKLSREEWESLQAERDRSKRQIEQQEQFIQRRNTELGSLRKQLEEQQRLIDERLADDDFRDNPVAVAQAVRAKEKVEENLKQVDSEERDLELFRATSSALQKVAKPEDGIGYEDMAKSLRRDGVSEELVSGFLQNPVKWLGDPVRAALLYGKTKAEGYVEKLYNHAKALQAENEKLKLEVRKAPERTISNINKALRSPPPLSSSQPTRSSSGKFSANPASMSREELDAFLERSTK